ncbi:type II toxin-antitoxin system PemK/MazF family toxin [Nibrella viscosa]|uniref:type II toxin-antitoxin system PemK/MazF family toxin n=1 Tax=Nibrella viscosa TaxID=1084524 RepID=UPI0031F0F8D3
MREGQIVLTELPQSDGTAKRRPALVLRQMPGYGDYLVCGLSSQLRQYIAGFDEVLQPDQSNGLRVASVVRLGFLSTVADAQILGQIGQVPAQMHRQLIQRLAAYLTL